MKKITQLLTRSNKQITQDRATRITSSVDTSFQKFILNLKGEIDQLEDQRDKMLDMSASNVTTTRNAVDDLNSDGFVQELVSIDTDIELKKRHLNIALGSKDGLLGEVEETEDE